MSPKLTTMALLLDLSLQLSQLIIRRDVRCKKYTNGGWIDQGLWMRCSPVHIPGYLGKWSRRIPPSWYYSVLEGCLRPASIPAHKPPACCCLKIADSKEGGGMWENWQTELCKTLADAPFSEIRICVSWWSALFFERSHTHSHCASERPFQSSCTTSVTCIPQHRWLDWQFSLTLIPTGGR